jgi:hypothetical protein
MKKQVFLESAHEDVNWFHPPPGFAPARDITNAHILGPRKYILQVDLPAAR